MIIQKVFENDFFIAVDKEAMVLTTPAREGEKDPRPCLGIALQEQVGQQIFPVHRLDYEVSGLVLFAKTAKAHSQANTWFEKKDVLKVYQAITTAKDDVQFPEVHAENLWKSRLLRGKRRSYEHEIGRPSETIAIYEGAEGGHKDWHCWELHPLTGRPHQLRYELSRHGFPIVGDPLYGGVAEFSQPGMALRAIRIDLSKAPKAESFGLPKFLEVAKLF